MSLTAAIALGVSATALAVGNTDNTAQVFGSLNSSLQDNNDPGKVSLFAQLTTYDNDNAPVIPADPPESEAIDFPVELTYKTNGHLAKCNPAAGTFATDGTDAAVAACRSSLVGAGNAIARIPAFPTTNNESELTVTAFNGLNSVAGDNESDQIAPPNGGFVGGKPTIILHADNAALPTTVVVGEVGDAEVPGTEFDRRLWVPDAPDVARVGPDDNGALVMFNAQVQKSWTNGKSGNQKKTYNLITATCNDPGGEWDFQREVTYDDDTSEFDTSIQDCTEK